MRPLIFLLTLSSLATLSAQKDGADPDAIAHIRAEYQQLEDTTARLNLLLLDDGTEVAMQGETIRRIIVKQAAGTSEAYYYTALGNPLFVFIQSAVKEERCYFDPQIKDGPGRLGMIRWIEGKNYRQPGEKAFAQTGEHVLSSAYDLLHRAQGELEFTAEIYGAITQRLAKIDQELQERSLVPIDTTDQLEEEEIPEDELSPGEPKNACWDMVIRFGRESDGKVLRTTNTNGCDPGCMAYTVYESTTEFDDRGNTLATRHVVNEYVFHDPDGRGPINWGVSATTTIYFDDNEPVYKLLTSKHQGFEVFRRLTILEE